MTRTSYLVAAAVGPLAVLLLAGCTGGQPVLSDLRRQPGVQAAYPGAVEYRRLETEASANAMAKNPAAIKVDACAPDGPAQVVSWFTRYLADAGWTRDPGHSVASDPGELQPEGTTWSRGDLHFELLFLTPAFADHLADEAGKPHGCAGPYETRVG